MPPPERQFLAQGPLARDSASSSAYVFQFSSDLVDACTPPTAAAAPPPAAATSAAAPTSAAAAMAPPKFINDVKCRRWTDTLERTERRGTCPIDVADPEPGRILNIGDITLADG